MTAVHGIRAGFVSTRWSQVVRADGDSPSGRAALAWLCEAYWEPLHRHARRRGMDADRAQDAVQGFFAALIERRDVGRADPVRGRFRTYLLACFDHWMANQHDRGHALKRGGGRRHVAMDALAGDEPAAPASDPEFDRDWARAVLARCLARISEEWADKERGIPFAVLRAWLPGGAGAPGGQAEVAASLGVGESALKVAIHRLRTRFREILRAEVAETVDAERPGAIDDELRDLLAALSAG